MGFKKAIVRDSGLNRETQVGDGLSVCGTRIVTNSTAGNQTITVGQMLGGVALFTGAAGGVAYTYPTGALISAAFPDMGVGDTYTFMVSNTAAQVATWTTALTGTTIAGFTTSNAGSRMVVMEKTAADTFTLTHV